MAHEAINCLDVAEAAVPMTAGNWSGIHDNLRTPRAGNVPGAEYMVARSSDNCSFSPPVKICEQN